MDMETAGEQPHQPFATVDDAICAGRSHLKVTCQPCRVQLHVPWGLLPRLLGSDRIDHLHLRLVCSKCGARPLAEDVETIRPGPAERG